MEERCIVHLFTHGNQFTVDLSQPNVPLFMIMFTECFNHYYMQSFCGRISSLNFKMIVIVKKISKLDGIIYIRIQTPLIPLPLEILPVRFVKSLH